MAKNFLDLMKHSGSLVNSKKNELRDTETHNQTSKSQTQRISKAAREKQITYKGSSIQLTDFSSETFKVRKQWANIFKELKGKNPFQPRLLYSAKLSFKSEREIKIRR